jgi:hypothetical protein
MKKWIVIFSLVILSCLSAFAGSSGKMSFACRVKNYDKEFIDLSCANVDKPVVMRTPARWLPKEFKIQRDAKVRLSLTSSQIEEWPKYSKGKKF